MLRIAVCDDERSAVDNVCGCIQKSLMQFDTEHEISIYSSGEQLLESNGMFDLIFLDIEMDGLNGIETAKQLRLKNVDAQIVYITSFSSYTKSAFSVHAFDYIEKPFKYPEIQKVLNDYMDLFLRRIETIDLESDGKIFVQKIDDIYVFRLESRERIEIFLKESKYYIKAKSLSTFANKLNSSQFYRINRDYVVNLNHVKSQNKYEIVLENGEICPLAIKKEAEFKRKLHDNLIDRRKNRKL